MYGSPYRSSLDYNAQYVSPVARQHFVGERRTTLPQSTHERDQYQRRRTHRVETGAAPSHEEASR